EQLQSLFLDKDNGSENPEVVNWEPCIEADDPVYIESIIWRVWLDLPVFTVTTDCGN
ncbi:MAG: hypothetical protein HKN89_08630, partial [Eudoraea sp.]|nr:hypothetical protein [Eudoraea sp.]